MRALNDDYLRIESAILFLERNFRERPDLRTIAASVNLSEHHFQRLFRRWAGISPKQFLQFLTLGYAKQLLKESKSLLDVTYESGLSSPGRLFALASASSALTSVTDATRGSAVKRIFSVATVSGVESEAR